MVVVGAVVLCVVVLVVYVDIGVGGGDDGFVVFDVKVVQKTVAK